MLIVTATEKLQEMDQSEGAYGGLGAGRPGVDGGPGGDFTSPSKPSSSGYCSSASSSMRTPGDADK